MGNFTDTAVYFIRFARKVLPEANKQHAIFNETPVLCIPSSIAQRIVSGDESRACRFTTDMLCSFLFSMVPDIDTGNFLSFMLSLYKTDTALEEYRKSKDMRDELDIRRLMGCLSGAADPSRSLVCKLKISAKDLPGRLNEEPMPEMRHTGPVCNAEHCRLQLAVLPSYKQVSGKIKKYMQLYIDLQSYRHYPAVISIDLLKTWSNNYLKRYHEIYWWEFCASADTFIGIAAMYAAASVRDVTTEEIRMLDEACFPWLCGFCSMLDHLIDARVSQGAESLNFSSYYSNLKECEDRLLFFAEKAEMVLKRLKGGSLYIHLMKIVAGLYLTDPEAYFGMLRITVSNIVRRGSIRTYCFFSNLMRTLRLL